MTLNNLVKKVRHLRKTDTRFAGLKVKASARLVLKMEFGTEPTVEEVIELAQEVKRIVQENRNFFKDWNFEEEANSKERQTGGGKEIVYKTEPRAG